MNKNDTKWLGDGSLIPDIEPHTKTKHILIDEYITNLIHTLYGKGRYGNTTFTFIDGFCGGGIYSDKESNSFWHGSPIRLIKAVRDGYLKSQRNYTLNIKFIFIEKNRHHLECLKKIAMPQAGLEELLDGKEHAFKTDFGQRIEQCEFICAEFEDVVNHCIFQADVRRGHSLFFLDHFGWDDVSMESFRKINKLNKSEIIYTFMTDYIKRFVFSKEGKERETFSKILETEGYFDINQLNTLDNFGEQAFYRNELMRLFRDKSSAQKNTYFCCYS